MSRPSATTGVLTGGKWEGHSQREDVRKKQKSEMGKDATLLALRVEERGHEVRKADGLKILEKQGNGFSPEPLVGTQFFPCAILDFQCPEL